MSVEPEAHPAEPTELGDEPSKLAGGCVAVVLVGGPLLGAVMVLPETAYVVVGVLGTVGVRKARSWAAARRDRAGAAVGSDAEVDIVEPLRELAADGDHVLLTRLQKAAGLPDTKAVRALLDAAGVRVRAGVRTPAGNGPGVHQDDIPPLLSPEQGPSSRRCLCSSGANANTNNGPAADLREGLRVETIGQAGTVVHDPAEAHRHHAVRAN